MPTFRIEAPAIYVEAEDADHAVLIAIEHWKDMPTVDYEVEEQ